MSFKQLMDEIMESYAVDFDLVLEDFDMDTLEEAYNEVNFNDDIRKHLTKHILVNGLHNKHGVVNSSKKAMNVLKNPSGFDYHQHKGTHGIDITKITCKKSGKFFHV